LIRLNLLKPAGLSFCPFETRIHDRRDDRCGPHCSRCKAAALRAGRVVNVELEDDQGFLGDRASYTAFRELLDGWRRVVRQNDGDDLFGDKDSEDIPKHKLDASLAGRDAEAAGVVEGAIEDFAQEFALVIGKFLKLKGWRDTERVAIGGGFRDSRFGELAIGRTAVILKANGVAIDLVALHNDPDEAALIGAGHLAPRMFKGHEAILAVDIGGRSIRVGVVNLHLKKAFDLSKARVWKMEEWRHADESKKPRRKDAVERLVDMLEDIIRRAKKEELALAPFIGIGCPGIISADGSVERGAQNLPGNWHSRSFNLPRSLIEAIPKSGDSIPWRSCITMPSCKA
jgi:hypothetical protein